MMCYKDRTWCDRQDCANFGEACSRSYTADVHKAAIVWWNNKPDPPVMFFMGTPECFRTKPENNTDKEEAYSE